MSPDARRDQRTGLVWRRHLAEQVCEASPSFDPMLDMDGPPPGSKVLARDAEAGRHEADDDLTSTSLPSVLLLRATAHVCSKAEGESVTSGSSTWR